MAEGLSLGEKIKKAVRGAAPAASRPPAGLSKARVQAIAEVLAADPAAPEPAIVDELAARAEPVHADQQALVLDTARRLATGPDGVEAFGAFAEALSARPTIDAFTLVELAKIAAGQSLSLAPRLVAAAAAAAPLNGPIACEHAAISLRMLGPIASLRALASHLTAVGGGALKSEDVRRHAGWALSKLTGTPSSGLDWPRLARAAQASAFDLQASDAPIATRWSSALLMVEALGEGRSKVDENEAAFLGLVLGFLRRELEEAGAHPRPPVADITRASQVMSPAALAVFVQFLAESGRLGEAVAIAGRLRDTPYEIEALNVQADHAPDRWTDRILPRWTKVSETYASDPALQFRSGRALMARGEVEAAIVSLTRATELSPTNIDYVVSLGGAHEVRGDWAAALATYEAGLDAGIDEPAIVRKRAGMLMELGLTEQAVEVMVELNGRLDRSPESLVVHAWSLERVGRSGEAARLLEEADVTPGDPPLLIETAVRIFSNALLKAGRAYADRRLFDKALELARGSMADLPQARFWQIVQAALELGEDEAILDLVDALLLADPDWSGDQNSDGYPVFLLRLAKTTLQGDLSRFGDQGWSTALQTMAMSCELQGRRALATAAMALCAFRSPKNEGLALAAGTMLLRHDRLTAAEKLFENCERAFEDSARNFIWPRSEAGRWPRGGGPSAGAFDALLPAGAEWPRITVVTPSYNQAEFVEDTVLSVLAQNYPNLQYIIVDGKSTDGAAQILERYRDQVDHLIIEKDKGQTDAINKGFALSDGELLTWLNSDDMFAPGALHRLALEYLETGADLIAGICVAYRDGRIEVANLPAVRQETFNVEVLSDIFRYWMKGYFFYQPEVIFSRAIWDKTGGKLDDSLNYTMDYEFWMRCAQAEARFQAVHWPIALFRQHEAQKTSKLLHCVDEQAQVRDTQLTIAPKEERARILLQGAQDRLRSTPVKVAVYTSRFDKIFSPLIEPELAMHFADTDYAVRLVTSPGEILPDDDFVVWLNHLQGDDVAIDAYRARGGKAQIIGWFWDNHHHMFPNRDVVERLDFWSAGHAFVSAYLSNDRSIQLPSTPLCVSQWSRQEARLFFEETRGLRRKDTLYGGFVRYAFAEKRNALIQDLMATGEEGVYFLEESAQQTYFERSRRSRFLEWAGHKTSLCLPLDGDLSQRLFDALLTGQVPIAPRDIADLDSVIPPALQKSLPIVRFDKYRPADVARAHEEAIRLYDRDGEEGALRRHQAAVEGHMFSDRVAALLGHVRAFAESR